MRWQKSFFLAFLIATSFVVSAQAGLVNYWTFDSDGSDSAGSLTGSFVGNAAVTNASGEYVQGTGALKVAHDTVTGDYFDVASNTIPDHGIYTLSCWYKWDDSFSTQAVDSRAFLFETTPSWTSSLGLYTNAFKPTFSADGTTGDVIKEVISTPVNDDSWHFFAVTYDTVNNESIYYHDGSATFFWTAPELVASTGLHIGNHRAGDGTRNWQGYVDDFAVYEGVISESDIYSLYAGYYTPETVPVDDSYVPEPLPPVPTGQPVAHWSFDSNYSSSVNNDLYQGTAHGGSYTSIDTSAGVAARGSGALKLNSGPSSGDGTFVDTEVGVGVLDPEVHKQVAVSSWFKVEDISGDGSDSRKFIYETAPDYTLSLEVQTSLNGTNFCKWASITDAGSSITTASLKNYGPEIESGQWCNVVTNYDLEAGRMQFYFNGELLYDQPLDGDSFIATDAFNIGNHRTGDGTRDFDGYIDDVAVYHGVMTPEAVAGLYNGTYSATNVPVASGLAAFTKTATLASEDYSQDLTGDFVKPAGLSYSSADNSLIVASRHATEGFIAKIAEDGTTTMLVGAADAVNIAATAVNPANGDLFFTSDYGGVIKRVAAGTTTVETWASGFHNDTNDDDPCSMVIVPDSYTGGLVEPGSLLVADRGSGGFEEVYSISTSAAETYTTLVSDSDMGDGVGNILIDPNAIAVTDTQIFISDFEARKIYEITAADTLVDFFEASFEAPIFSMIADPSTGDLITLNGVGEVHRINTTTGVEELILSLEEKCQTGTATFNQLVISDDGNQLVVGSPDMDTIYLFSLGSPNIPGDANNDGKVDGSDVTILAGNWQKGVDDGLTASWEEGDFNGDGKVDGSDVTILAGNWQYGVDATTASVPEPTSLVILISLALTVACLRRR